MRNVFIILARKWTGHFEYMGINRREIFVEEFLFHRTNPAEDNFMKKDENILNVISYNQIIKRMYLQPM